MKHEAAVLMAVRAKLPRSYEPLLLAFYHDRLKLAGQNLVIGNDDGAEFCCSTESDPIWEIDPEGVLPVRFVNSSIHALASFIARFDVFLARVRSLGDAESMAAAKLFREELRVLDPAAFQDEECWWSVILEQYEDGIL